VNRIMNRIMNRIVRSSNLPSPSILRSALALFLTCASSSLALAQGTPIVRPVDAPGQAKPAPQRPLPPPVSESERRFRSLADYIRARGAIDAATRADVERLAGELDADIARPDSPAATVTRLLAARIQTAAWLDDRNARNAAFEKLVGLDPGASGPVIAWARELAADGEFERAYDLVARSKISPDRLIDARIVQAECLFAMNRFEDARTVASTAPSKRSLPQRTAIAQVLARSDIVEPLWASETAAMARDQARGDLPIVEFLTSRGAITIELFEDQAPNTVGNIIEHVEAGTYDGTRFHRIIRGLGVQGGDPATATGGTGGTSTGGWTIPDESTSESKRAPLIGRLVVALQPDPQAPGQPQPHSGGCQFMILLNHFESLRDKYTVFGRVTEGLDVARQLTPDDVVVTARVIQKREQSYKGVRFSTDAAGNFALPVRPVPAKQSPTDMSGVAPEDIPDIMRTTEPVRPAQPAAPANPQPPAGKS
jgi:cyclophilin family peptidyl-prolyl cis-trans isomerase